MREQYATEHGLAARASIYGAAGVVVLEEIVRLHPVRLLEVGYGWGELAPLVARKLISVFVATKA